MSKANQAAFKQNDEAVSPVIGVILMVAITVVLAAVVFVLVSNLSKGANNAAPQVAFTKDEQGSSAGGVLTVVSITNGPLDTSKVVVGGVAPGAAGVNCKFNGAALTGSGALKAATVPATTLKAGDQISCSGATAIGTITLSDTGTNTLLYTGDFQ
jgi:flagellin-like protein